MASVRPQVRRKGSFTLHVDERYSDIRVAGLSFHNSNHLIDDFDLFAELHLMLENIESRNLSFRIGIKEARMVLEYNNCHAIAGTRFGELDKSPGETSAVKVHESSSRRREGNIEGSATAGWRSLTFLATFAGKSHASAEKIEQSEVDRVDEHRRVVADTFGWTIRIIPEDTTPFLEGRYIKPDVSLCRIRIIDSQFSVVAKVNFQCRPDNIYIDRLYLLDNNYHKRHNILQKFELQRNKNRLRAIKLVIAKALRKVGTTICVCEHTITPAWKFENENTVK